MQRVLLFVSICIFTCSPVLAVEFSADIVTQGFVESRGKIYFKDIELHRSEGLGMINITKSPVVYQLVTDTKKYTVQNLDDQRKENPMGDFGNIKEMVEKNNLKETGKEKIEGFPCVIYEGKVKIDDEAPPVPMKIWYSEKLEVPVKQEMTLGAPMGKIVSLLNNIKIGKQNSSLFDIPPGYEKVNSMEEAMGMGNFQMPAMGGESGQGPSEEDMKKMMEKMEQMMREQQP
jgi:hypothetical protein